MGSQIEKLLEYALEHGWKFAVGMIVLVVAFMVLSASEGKRGKSKDNPPDV